MKAHAQAVADALWDGVRHEPPLASADTGMRSWYLRRVYHPVVGRRRERVWARRSPEPWLTAQWLLERSAGQRTERGYLRFEGLPGQHSYDHAYRAVSLGRYEMPFLFVAGYSRSGTTSLQNLVRTAFPDHIAPGGWDDPGHPLRLWWYPKHNAQTAARIAGLGSESACTLLCIRPFVESAASLAVYSGFVSADDISDAWVEQQLADWRRMAQVAALPGALTVGFSLLTAYGPRAIAAALGERLGLVPIEGARLDTWEDVYAGGISPEVLDHPLLSNLPHEGRRPVIASIGSRIEAQLGARLDVVEDQFEQTQADALVVDDASASAAVRTDLRE